MDKKVSEKKVVVTKNGPYVVSGKIPLAKEMIVSDEKGNSVRWAKGEKYPEKETYSLCRCGKSANMPYCDGTHIRTGFRCDDTASKKRYIDQASKISGPTIDLTDFEDLCVLARFCHNKTGRVWQHIENSDDSKSKEMAIQQACNCPGGRLVVWDKDGEPIEPKFEQSISLVEYPLLKISGSLWIKGGIAIELQDGTKYEIRNRVTLCRCGKSGNKPLCDGSHEYVKFNDGDKNLK